MTRERSTQPEVEVADRWYVPLLIAAAVVIALLVAGVAALEVFAARNAAAASDGPRTLEQVKQFTDRQAAVHTLAGGRADDAHPRSIHP